MKFVPVRENVDIDIHPDPPAGWSKIAICCRWWDPKRARRDWHHAAVVAPLRTADGLDELVRNLLANVHIDVLLVVGPDLLDGQPATQALDGFFLNAPGAPPSPTKAAEPVLESDLASCPGLDILRSKVFYARETAAKGVFQRGFELLEMKQILAATILHTTRERFVLPPPSPKVKAEAPHGDPGERVVADTLAGLWPLVLRNVMKFGRTAGTQYGPTREYLNLVSVIRDPVATVAEMKGPVGSGQSSVLSSAEPAMEFIHPVLGMSFSVVDGYYRNSLVSKEAPEGAIYGYGSRMHGTASSGQSSVVSPAELPTAHCPLPTDQFDRTRRMLQEGPWTRAAFMTPWRPEEDSGLESGRPCLTGAWFRTVGEWSGRVKGKITGTEGTVIKWPTDPVGAGTAVVLPDGEEVTVSSAPGAWELLGDVVRPRLHLTVTFRSHDMFGGYPKNLGAFCLFLIREAEVLGMEPGTVTCVSFSAHVYERHWNVAQTLADTFGGRGMRWDQRSNWRVERIEEIQPLPAVGTTVFYEYRSDHLTMACRWEIVDYVIREGETEPRTVKLRPVDDNARKHVEFLLCDPIRPPPKRLLRAIAMEPGGSGKVIGVFEAYSSAALQRKIETSGLVTEVSNALWLGSEIERCEIGL